jgi:predicted anti-sigma-YlaC factor YlaD
MTDHDPDHDAAHPGGAHDAGRPCREVRAHLPAYVGDQLSRWRRRLIDLHLRRCDACRAQLALEQEVAAGLHDLGPAAAPPADPPDGLLDALLGLTEDPGVRERAAVAARGAVSGARPGLSAALLLAGAVAGTALGYTLWRAVRAAAGWADRPRRS